MSYVKPQSLSEALTLLGNDSWSILSGGTDFYPALQEQPIQGNVLDLWGLNELRAISHDEDFVRIGALVTWSDIIAEDLPPAFDGLKLAAREVGSVQIQNRATVVGNICNASPAADGVPPLLTLSAVIELASESGTRHIPLQDFILGNRSTVLKSEELVSAILIPTVAMRGKSSFIKLGARKYLVISISMIAARLTCDENLRISDAAISVGSCSLVAKRLSALEQALVGQVVSSDLAALVTPLHLNSLSPIDDVRASQSYRMDATLELVRRVLINTGKQFT